MSRLMIRRLIVVTITPLKSLRFLSSSSEIKQNAVVAFFKNYGFSKSQISVTIEKLPRLLSAKPEKSLLPKLLFFQSKGLSSSEVAKLVTVYPYILIRSLTKHIIPTFDYCNDLLCFKEITFVSMKRFAVLLRCGFSNIRHNIETLSQIGVPHSNIGAIIRLQPRALAIKPLRFKETVEEVKEMGFNPLRSMFVLAVAALRAMSKSTWKKKVEVYRKWGCSEEDVLSAFGRHPACMMSSEDKIDGVMDYFVNQIGRESSFVTKNPSLLCYSLKTRIVPRGSVYRVLSTEGLMKEDVTLYFFNISEKSFLERFVKPHEKHIPGLLKLYEGLDKLDLLANKEI